MDQELMKVAEAAPAVLLAAAQHLKKLAGDNTALLTRAESAEHALACYKLAQRMDERGIQQELSLDQKVASLLKLPMAKLSAVEQAVELSAGGFRLGTISEDPKTASQHAGVDADALDSFVNSGAAYGA